MQFSAGQSLVPLLKRIQLYIQNTFRALSERPRLTMCSRDERLDGSSRPTLLAEDFLETLPKAEMQLASGGKQAESMLKVCQIRFEVEKGVQ